jgi:hypothetical protein
MMPELELDHLDVFPCRADKRPACPGGFYSAVQGRDRIEDLFRRYPGSLVGMPTGEASGIDVLDIDRGGEDWLSLYEATHGLPPTRIIATRSGGLHLYFKHHVGMRCSAGLLAPNVDIRSTGGYVILWDRAGCRVLSSAPIAPWPPMMLQLLHEATEARRPTPNSFCASPVTISNQGDRFVPKPLQSKINEVMKGARLKHQRRSRGILRPLVEARDGRNWALYEAALQFRELISAGIIDRAGTEKLLFLASELNGYVALRGEYSAKRTIKSGLEAQPRSRPGKHKKEEEEGRGEAE